MTLGATNGIWSPVHGRVGDGHPGPEDGSEPSEDLLLPPEGSGGEPECVVAGGEGGGDMPRPNTHSCTLDVGES